MTPFDDFIRPQCDDCGRDLRLKVNAVDADGKTHPTSWVCECGTEYYSDKTVQEWFEDLKNETGEQNDKAEK